MVLQLGAVTGFLVFGALVDRLGRKPMFVAYIFIGLAVAAYAFGPATTRIVAIFFSGLSVNGIFAPPGRAGSKPDWERRFAHSSSPS
ncbi:MAG TPA: hypothetical protein VKY22_02530 [Bradyrhizobium sp.]|nr:hypothetical protein [Bradyrhizobium sp.]